LLRIAAKEQRRFCHESQSRPRPSYRDRAGEGGQQAMTTVDRPKGEKFMPEARYIVEEHIRHFGMVPHPDLLKEAIARALRLASEGVSPI